MDEKKSYFDVLYSVNVNNHTEKRKDLTYLSWTWAVQEVTQRYPDMTYRIIQDPVTHLPYFYDENTGYMVMTEVTIDDHTKMMWLPVMDSNNKAMKKEPYEIKTKYGKVIHVNPCTMFDVNKAIMRCLTKNIAMFGLGLYIYAGEDLPEVDEGNVDGNATITKADAPMIDPHAPIPKRNVDIIESWIKKTGTDRAAFVGWAGKEPKDFTMEDYGKAFKMLKAKEERMQHTQREIKI